MVRWNQCWGIVYFVPIESSFYKTYFQKAFLITRPEVSILLDEAIVFIAVLFGLTFSDLLALLSVLYKSF